eukprot:Seg1393.8 transcript_id=Seg1393.8/GoldUCD/mRNA.D3Y31 product="WD repeat-containing protein 93" protein_id=Seg1393.8/GoldUCD/D3Y31
MSSDIKRSRYHLSRYYDPPTPSCCSEAEDEERGRYFLEDPDIEFDELPQPFRRIDKILEILLDNVNEELKKVDRVQTFKQKTKSVPTFKRPVTLDCSLLEDEVVVGGGDNAKDGLVSGNVLVSATTNNIFVAKERSLLAIHNVSKKHLARVEVDVKASSICMLETLTLTTSDNDSSVADVIFLFDDNGSPFTFIFCDRSFIPIRVTSEGRSQQAKVISWEYCADANVVCIIKWNINLGYFVEICRLPRDQWANEAHDALSKLESLEDSTQSIESNVKENIPQKQEENEELTKSSPSISAMYFTQMPVLATLQCQRETPCPTTNLTSLMKGLEAGKVGSGEKHPLGSAFFDGLRLQLKDQLNELFPASIAREKSDTGTTDNYPTVHFLKRLDLPSSKVGSEYTISSCPHELIGVCWSSRNHFLMYKLPKSGRELQIEMVYPNADSIIASSVNKDTNLIALVLQNKNVVVWDRLSGEPSRILVFENEDISFMKFGAVGDQHMLIMGMQSGSLSQIDCSNKDLAMKALIDQSSFDQNKIVFMKTLAELPYMLFVATHPNSITIFDLKTCSAFFHFQLPEDCSFDPTVEECFKFDASMSKLIVFGKKIVQYDHHRHAVFSFEVCFSEILPEKVAAGKENAYGTRVAELNGLEKVAVSVLSEITDGKKDREIRQQRRWNEYLRELEQIN